MIPLIILGIIFITVCIVVTRVLVESGETELAAANAAVFSVMMLLIVLFVISVKRQQKESRYERIEEPLYKVKQ